MADIMKIVHNSNGCGEGKYNRQIVAVVNAGLLLAQVVMLSDSGN